MDIKELVLYYCCIFSMLFLMFPLSCHAGENQHQNPLEKNYSPITFYQNDWAYNLNTEFEVTADTQTSTNEGTPRELLNSVESPDNDEKTTSTYFVKKSFEDKILDKIPHGSKFKQMWNIVDGDVDLHFTGLRADRSNRGLSYSLYNQSFIGDMNDIEIEFSAGQENKVSFKTQMVPFLGKLEGFSLKGSAGMKDSNLFARYTVPLD